MASPSTILLSKIIGSGGKAFDLLTHVLEEGITAEHMGTASDKAIFFTLCDYAKNPTTKLAVFGPNMMNEYFPSYDLVDDESMTIDAIIHEVKKAKARISVQDLLLKVAAAKDDDPVYAAQLLLTISQEIVQENSSRRTDHTFSDMFDEILFDYDKLASGETNCVLPWPWSDVTNITGGIEGADFNVIYGRPKSMKTFVLCYLLAFAYAIGHRVVIYTKEMTPKNILMRIAAFYIRAAYGDVKFGRLNSDMRDTFYQFKDVLNEKKAASNGYNDIIVLSGRDVGVGKDTPMWIRSKINHYKPSVVGIDGFYLMSSDEGSSRAQEWQRVMGISRSLRGIPLDFGVPIIGTTQANRTADKKEEASSSDIGYSDAIAQDATLFARSIPNYIDRTITLSVGGAREYSLDGFKIHAKPCTNFEFIEVLNKYAIETEKTRDDQEALKEELTEEVANKIAKRKGKSKKETELEQALKDIVPENIDGLLCPREKKFTK